MKRDGIHAQVSKKTWRKLGEDTVKEILVLFAMTGVTDEEQQEIYDLVLAQTKESLEKATRLIDWHKSLGHDYKYRS